MRNVPFATLKQVQIILNSLPLYSCTRVIPATIYLLFFIQKAELTIWK